MKKIVFGLVCLLTFTLVGCEQKTLDAFDGTPQWFVVNEGEIVESMSPVNSEDGHDLYFEDVDKLDELIKDNELIDKKKDSGSLEQISYDTFLKMQKDKEHFIVLVSQTGCPHCNIFKEEVLDGYLKTNAVTVYEINITNENKPQETYDALREIIS